MNERIKYTENDSKNQAMKFFRLTRQQWLWAQMLKILIHLQCLFTDVIEILLYLTSFRN